MKWYIETNKFNLAVEADTLHDALRLLNHVVFGMSLRLPANEDPDVTIDRVSKKPTRKINYLEVV